MALQKSTTSPQGFNAENAYHRVENVSLLNKNSLNFMVLSYVSPSNNVSFQVDTYNCDYDLEGDNPIKQAYEYLKTLPEFSGATDC
jgi:hypothetical protein